MTLGGGGRLVADEDEQGVDQAMRIARLAAPPMSAASRREMPDAAFKIARGLSRLRRWGRGTTPSDQDSELTPSALTSSMLAVAALQRADGSWELTAALARAIGHDLAELEALLLGATGNEEETRKAWATALALAWLEERARDQEGEWRLLGAKARAWLDGVTARPAHGGSWAEAARALTSSIHPAS